jgi:hypothetical protein
MGVINKKLFLGIFLSVDAMDKITISSNPKCRLFLKINL